MQQHTTNQLPITIHLNSSAPNFLQIISSINELLVNGVEPKNIAVVYSINQYEDKLFSQFLQNQIPFNCNNPFNVLHSSLSNQLITLLKYLAAEVDMPTGGDDLLFEILHFKWFNIPPVEIAKLTAEVADRRFGKDKTTLRQHLLYNANNPAKDLFTPPSEGFKKASDCIEKLITELPGYNLLQLFDNILSETGVLNYVKQQPASKWNEAIITSWINFIQITFNKNASLSLNQLITMLNKMERENQLLPLIESCYDLNGVHVLTSTETNHTSFDYVFKVGNHVNINEHSLEHSVPTIERFEADFIDRVLNKFVMNVSALNTYLNCPLQFYFNYIVRVPPVKSTAFAFGSAVHYALECLFVKMQPSNTFPAIDVLLNDFQQYMVQNRVGFTEASFNQKMQHGHSVLTNYYHQYIAEWNKIVVIERTFKNITLGGIPLKGKMDKLEFNGKKVNIVDYKTGNVERALEKLQPPNEAQPHGGDYWRQAVFYKILIDNYEDGKWQAMSSEFDFIEPNQNNALQKVKLEISAADIATVTHQLTEAWGKIQDRQFYNGCGKPTCGWCGFVKMNEE